MYTKKYLVRLLLSISLVVVTMLLILSFVTNWYSKQAVSDVLEESNGKVVSQIHYNIKTLDDIIKNLALVTFFDPYNVTLMYSRDLSIEDAVPRMNRLDKTVNSTAFLHSIVVYNVYSQTYYSTEERPRSGLRKLIEERAAAETTIEKLKLIRTSPDVFSYYICESEICSRENSYIVFNVKAEWMLQHIQSVNLIANNRSAIFLTDTVGKVLLGLDEKPVSTSSLSAVVQQEMNEMKLMRPRMDVVNLDGKKMIVTMMPTLHEWVVVSLQPYDSVFGKITQMKKLFVLITLALILLSLAVSLLVSRKLYKPIDKLLRQVQKDNLPGGDYKSKDELSVLSSMYASMAQHYHRANRDYTKYYLLRKLVQSSFDLDSTDLSGISFIPNGRFIVAVLKIDEFSRFQRDPYYSDKNLFRFAIVNIGEEIFKSAYPTEIIEMKEDQFAVLIRLPQGESEESVNDRIADLLREVQSIMNGLYRISLTAGLGEIVEDWKRITASYESAFQLTQYRMVLGKGHLITADSVKDNLANESSFMIADWEVKLQQLMKSGDFQGLSSSLDECVRQMYGLSYNNIFQSVISVILVLNKSIEQLNAVRVQPFTIDLREFYQVALEKETLSEIVEMFHDLCLRLEDQSRHSEKTRNSVLVDTIKLMIEENYSREQLGLQSIAVQFKMSPVYLGQLFKSYGHDSIAEYINQVRMRHTLELLEKSSSSVKEIMEKVGFTNESHFYKLFRKQFGVTPKEYRMRKSIE